MRLGEAAPDRLAAYGRDPRVGDAIRGADIARGVWRVAAERMMGEYAIPWERPHPSRHFTARLHAFAWLADLAAANAPERIVALTESWVEAFGEWDELAWDAELTAERVFAWLSWGRPAFEQGAPVARAALMRSAARQVRLLLMAQSELGDRHCGAIKAGAALVLAGAAGFPDADRLIAQGEEMLIEACAKQFLPDGGHLSRSPEALAESFYDLMTAHTVLETHGDPSPVIRDALPKLANMLRMLRMGDGGLGAFQGGSENSPASVDAALARVGGDARAFQFATHSAYQRLEAKELVVLFDVGGAPPPAFSERAHAGALAFELSSGRERLIVNVGAARELEPAGRQAARATNAHSTLVLADALSASLEEQRRGKGAARLSGPTLDDVRRSSDESGVTVQGRHDGYRAQFGLLHRRYLFVDHVGRNLRGIDELMRPVRAKGPNIKQPIPFVARFHLHPSVYASAIEHQMVLLQTPGGQRWRFRTDAPNVAIEPSIYWAGRTVPQDTLQIVLSGAADPQGHGLSPPNRIRWALARSD
ncbi:MAG TPA: heparinase II/III family protein [Caulobacterales bacterium]|nr:heparinase II/III family protein [Caulobacterales bacterium]